MSKFYKENNNESEFELFNKKIVYKSNLENAQYTNLTDFVAEKIMYGRVDRNFIPITIPQDSTRIKSFSSNSQTDQNFKALNFVVDAFYDLQKQFKKCALIGKIDIEDEYLTNLKIYKAYEDPRYLYEKYMRNFTLSLKNNSLMDSNKILNFNNMSENLQNVMQRSGRTNPITFPAFVKSRKISISVSGLAIEIADLSYNNDDEKINQFVNSKNWDFYLNTCRTYGFMVDKEVPWRLVADIGSQPMIEYAAKYNLNDTNSILFNCYEKSSYQYYKTFTQRMYNMYYNIKPNNITEVSECKGKTLIKKRIPTKYLDKNKLQESYGQENFLMLYCKLRFTEEESQFTEEEKNILINDVIEISQTNSDSYAINQFEKILNKTFDYQGSLTYYLTKSLAEENEKSTSRIYGGGVTTGY